MFSKTVVNSARFLRMPQTSRLLYYDLGMMADDDGVVEAFTVLRTTGAAEDDLRVLAAKGFITILNDDLVAYIKDWTLNNQLRRDRYHKSVYAELLVKLADGNQPATIWQPDGNQPATESSIGKSSQVEVSLVEDRGEGADKPPTPARRKYGQYGWVKLTEDEYNRLLSDLGQAELDRCIQYIDESAQGNGNKNRWKDWNLVLRRCHREGWGGRLTEQDAPSKPRRYRTEIIDGVETAVEVTDDV